jgi:hypothetical protein
MKNLVTLPLLILSLNFISCSKNGTQGNCGSTNISTVSRSSHNAQKSCTTCHNEGGEGRGCFTVCGTAYQKDKISPITNAIIVLFSEPNGKGNISSPITCDKSGNFYTTENIDFKGKYPAIIANGDTTFMGSSLTSTASCNSCHSNQSYQETIYSNY